MSTTIVATPQATKVTLAAGDSLNVVLTGGITTAKTAVGNTGGIGSVTNDGKISAASKTAIVSNAAIGSVTNTGTIVATKGRGIYDNGGQIGTVTNSGTISGPAEAIISTVGITEIDNSGTLSSSGKTVYVTGSAGLGTLNNSGSITTTLGTAVGTAVYSLSKIGTVTNGAGAVISANSGYGIYVQSTLGTLKNDGAISTLNGTGVYGGGLTGQLTNTGTIAGTARGVYDYGGFTALDNSGTISATAGNGILVVKASGTLTNSGMISGSTYGFQTFAAVTEVDNNGGTISASNPTGIGLGLASVTTITNSGGISGGTASGGLAINVSGTLGSLTNAGTIQAYSGIYAYGVAAVENSGTITGSGGGANAYAIDFHAAGSKLTLDPTSVINGLVKNDVSGDTLVLGGSDPFTVTGIGTQYLGFSTFNFANANATIEGTAAALANGQAITGFTGDDQIILDGFAETSFSYDPATGLTLTNAGGSKTLAIDIGSSLTTKDFKISTVNGNTSIGPPCYCRGTLILTTTGEVAVEDLAVGDLVVTASREHRPIVWLGHRKLDLTNHPDPKAVQPIRVSQSAFGENKPSRDLWLSPGHNIVADGVLMAASKLVNGTTIVQHEQPSVEYWHVELDRHDIILAEGLEAESYLDTGNRTGFANGGDFIEAHPDFAPKHWAETCVPLVHEGPEIIRTKAMLIERANAFGFTVTREADPHIVADGKRVEPVRLNDYRLAFMLPADCREIVLFSRTFVPAHSCPDSQDGRELGINMKRLQIDGEEIDLNGELLSNGGWNGFEREGEHGRRWTSGRAPLPAGSRLIVIDLNGRGFYWTQRRDNVVALFA